MPTTHADISMIHAFIINIIHANIALNHIHNYNSCLFKYSYVLISTIHAHMSVPNTYSKYKTCPYKYNLGPHVYPILI